VQKTICVSIALAVALTGCATWGQFDAGLHTLVGQPLSTATDVLGYPTGEREIAGLHLVQWGRSSQGFVPITMPVHSYGTVSGPGGFGSFSSTSSQTSFVPVHYNCSITLRVDSTNVVTGYNYEGNLGGCGSYIKRLNQYRKLNGG
jgi:hypothetical protein